MTGKTESEMLLDPISIQRATKNNNLGIAVESGETHLEVEFCDEVENQRCEGCGQFIKKLNQHNLWSR